MILDQSFSLSIDTWAKNSCQRQVASFLSQRDQFVEVGGYLLGTYQNVPKIECFDIDLKADVTPTSIRFSDDYIFKTEAKINALSDERNMTYRILGTWHVHPQSFGLQYSLTDENHLFLERMLIYTDQPHAVHPVIHVIFDRNMENLRAYAMCMRPEYHLEAQPPLNQALDALIHAQIDNGEEIGLFYDDVLQLSDYSEEKLINVKKRIDGIGVWKLFPLKIHPWFTFEKVYFENFFQKTKMPEFLFLMIYPDNNDYRKRLVKVKRYAQGENLPVVGFRDVPIHLSDCAIEKPKITLQNPDTKEIFEIAHHADMTVEEIKQVLKNEFDVNGEIICFTYFGPTGQAKYAELVQGKDSRILLPDRMSYHVIEKQFEEQPLPIYFYNNRIDEEKRFQLRTNRFRAVGYDIEKINKSHIFLGGVGILGNEVAHNLATLGIGKLTLIDNGRVDWYNLYRQSLFDSSDDVYCSKAIIAKEKLEQFGNIEIIEMETEVPNTMATPDFDDFRARLVKIEEAIVDVDIVVGLFDTYSARAILQILSIIEDKVFITAAVGLNEGEITVHHPDRGHCYCCGKPDPGTFHDGGDCTLTYIESHKIIGALTTKVIVDHILGRWEQLCNQLSYQVSDLTVAQTKVKGSPKCKVCGPDGIKQILKHGIEDKYQMIYDWLYGH